jgi:hypothetical protein
MSLEEVLQYRGFNELCICGKHAAFHKRQSQLIDPKPIIIDQSIATNKITNKKISSKVCLAKTNYVQPNILYSFGNRIKAGNQTAPERSVARTVGTFRCSICDKMCTSGAALASHVVHCRIKYPEKQNNSCLSSFLTSGASTLISTSTNMYPCIVSFYEK